MYVQDLADEESDPQEITKKTSANLIVSSEVGMTFHMYHRLRQGVRTLHLQLI